LRAGNKTKVFRDDTVMSSPITAKISSILTEYAVVLNAGANKGIKENMRFEVLATAIQVKDPDSGEELGSLHYVKARVKVATVYEKYSVAESYETVTRDIFPFPSYLTTQTITKKLPLSSSVVPSMEKEVKVGDEVRQIVEEEKTEKPRV
jgi:hypothetical protein